MDAEADVEPENRFGWSVLVGNVLGAALLVWVLFLMARC
jgi:hypothetical protein